MHLPPLSSAVLFSSQKKHRFSQCVDSKMNKKGEKKKKEMWEIKSK